MTKYVQTQFANFDDLDINSIQAAISNQEISYNQLLNNPKGILRTAFINYDILIGCGHIRKWGPTGTSTNGAFSYTPNISIPDFTPTKINVMQLTYSEFDLTRIYRVRAGAFLIRGMPQTIGAMDIIDDSGKHLRSANFLVPQPPHLSALFRPTKQSHTFTWRASTCNSGLNSGINFPVLNKYQSYTIDGTTTGSPFMYLEDMGTFIASNGPAS